MGFKKGYIPWNKGKSGWRKNFHHTKETKEKMKIAREEFFKRGGIVWIKGKKHTEETIKKIRIARARQISPWLGKKRSFKTIEKIRLANIGKRRSPATEFKNGNIPWDKGKKLHYKVVTAFKKGETAGAKNYRWKGGITGWQNKIRTSTEYKIWRKKVFERDNYKCVNCKKKGGYLIADHIKPFAFFPELRLEVLNGRTLCKNCDKLLGWRGKKYEK